MKREIAARFSDTLLQALLAQYMIDPQTVSALDGFESFIYTCMLEDRPRILRVSHTDRYPADQVRGELDWLRHLAAGGARVAAPVRSRQGNLVETVEDGFGGQFVASAFERAPGDHMRDEWTDAFIQHYGETLGKIHRLSTQYTPANPAWKRPAWNAPNMLDVLPFLQTSAPDVYARMAALIAYLKLLPRTDDSYGLIHQDAHAGNFFVHDGEIILFDFADAVYGWYVYDIALVLFYAMTIPHDDPLAYANRFLTHFLMGYQREFKLAGRLLREIPHFLKLREIDLFGVILRDIPDYESSAWTARFMAGRRERIVQDVPYLDLDFSRFEKLLT